MILLMCSAYWFCAHFAKGKEDKKGQIALLVALWYINKWDVPKRNLISEHTGNDMLARGPAQARHLAPFDYPKIFHYFLHGRHDLSSHALAGSHRSAGATRKVMLSSSSISSLFGPSPSNPFSWLLSTRFRCVSLWLAANKSCQCVQHELD